MVVTGSIVFVIRQRKAEMAPLAGGCFSWAMAPVWCNKAAEVGESAKHGRCEWPPDTLELALKASGCDQARVVHKPRLLSDNGSRKVQIISRPLVRPLGRRS